MEIQEQRKVVNIATTLIITAIYFWYVFKDFNAIGDSTDELLYFWAKSFLIFIPVGIVAKIVIHILYGIGRGIAKKDIDYSNDERDKLIELKSNRNAQYFFCLGVVLAMVAVVMGYGVNTMFVVLIACGVMAEILDNLSQIYFYRKGI